MFIDKKDFEEWMRRILERLDLLENRLAKPKNPRPDIDGERLLDNSDLCFMLSCSKRTLQRYRSSGNLPFRRVKQKTYYLESEVLTFVREYIQKQKRAVEMGDSKKDME
jgi:hypothetical protein